MLSERPANPLSLAWAVAAMELPPGAVVTELVFRDQRDGAAPEIIKTTGVWYGSADDYELEHLAWTGRGTRIAHWSGPDIRRLTMPAGSTVLDAGPDWVLLGQRGELDVPTVAVYGVVERGEG